MKTNIDPYKDFVDLGHRPKQNDLVCLFKVHPAKGMSMENAMGRIASESSNGTWAELTTLKDT